MEKSKLPSELISLIHHVQLNKAGWWKKANQRFITAALWFSGTNMSQEALSKSLREDFFMPLDPSILAEQIRTLQASGKLIILPDNQLKLSEQARREIEDQLKDAETIDKNAKNRFIEVFRNCCSDIQPEAGWKSFREQLLIPMVREIGAKTYELISGASSPLESTVRFSEFLHLYPSDSRHGIQKAIISFLDPKNSDIRSYILRYLNAYFFIEASNLKQSTLDRLASMTTSTSDSETAERQYGRGRC